MHTHARRLATNALPLALGLALFAGDGGQAAHVPRPISGEMVLARIEPDELTKYLHKVIQEELKAPAPSEPAVTKVRATALLIASQAQNGRGARDLWQRIALRDNALRVQKALADGKIDLARQRAGALFEIGTPPKDARRVELKGILELDEVEQLMKRRDRGGLGFDLQPTAPNGRDSIEVALMNFARKAPTGVALDGSAEHIARAASITAAMAGLVDAYAPEKRLGNKDPKDWKAAAMQMRTAAEELEAAAKAKDPNRIRAAAARVTASCNDCHAVFRD
jgi:hypothetical protein